MSISGKNCHAGCEQNAIFLAENFGQSEAYSISAITAIGPAWTCMPGALYRTQSKADFHALICATFLHFKRMPIIVLFFTSVDNFKLKKYIFLELGLIFIDNWVRFSSEAVLYLCVCMSICVYIYILLAELACFMTLLNQLFEYSKSRKYIAHISFTERVEIITQLLPSVCMWVCSTEVIM